MDRWDLILLASAAYLAVVALVRMMAGHRNAVVQQLRERHEAERARGSRSDDRKKGRQRDEAA